MNRVNWTGTKEEQGPQRTGPRPATPQYTATQHHNLWSPARKQIFSTPQLKEGPGPAFTSSAPPGAG